MRLIVKNPSSDNYSYVNSTIVVPAGSSLEVLSKDWFNLYSDNNFWKDLKENNITINDGIKNYNFEDAENYLKLIVADLNFNNKDVDGALIVRTKAAQKGWSFWAVAPEITTSTIAGSLYCKDHNGNDISGVSCKIYNANNEEITTPGLAGINLTTCVKTVLDIEVPFDIELIGGSLRINSNPGQDVRIWIVGAPDIPPQFGGSKEFASGINLKFLAPDNSFDVDGRVTKYITYSNITHSGKIRMIVKHGAGLTLNMQIVLHTYRL